LWTGIGKAVAEAFVREGAKVVVADLQAPAAGTSDDVLFSKCDVTRAEGTLHFQHHQ
jgi:NAD(P)-dependent dehydrogenase (short-subunit alcohol dehydrogenase family)